MLKKCVHGLLPQLQGSAMANIYSLLLCVRCLLGIASLHCLGPLKTETCIIRISLADSLADFCIEEVYACPGVRRCAARTCVLSIYSYISHCIRLAVLYNPTLHYGNMLEQCNGMLQTARAACFPEPFPCAPWCHCSLNHCWLLCSVRAACSVLHNQAFPLSCCHNDVYWVAHTSTLLHFSWVCSPEAVQPANQTAPTQPIASAPYYSWQLPSFPCNKPWQLPPCRSLATDLIGRWSITSAHAGSLIKC